MRPTVIILALCLLVIMPVAAADPGSPCDPACTGIPLVDGVTGTILADIGNPGPICQPTC